MPTHVVTLGEQPARDNRPGDTELACSFCFKRMSEVKQLFAGPRVYICDECVLLCVDELDAAQ